MNKLWIINLLTAIPCILLIVYGPIWQMQIAGWALLIATTGLGVFNYNKRNEY